MRALQGIGFAAAAALLAAGGGASGQKLTDVPPGRQSVLVAKLLLLTDPGVRAEVKATDDQVRRVKEAQEKRAKVVAAGFKQNPPAAAFRKAMAEADKELNAVLDAGQVKRLAELELQASGPAAVITHAGLPLTVAQQIDLNRASFARLDGADRIRAAKLPRDETVRQLAVYDRETQRVLVALLPGPAKAQWDRLTGPDYRGYLPSVAHRDLDVLLPLR